jgi:dipeptidyl aminopeptidase/acylaminoacyl peptidase
MLRLDGGDATAITPADNEQSISTFAFSPDGKTIAYLSADEKTEEEKAKKKDGNLDPDVWGDKWEFARLRLVEVETKQVRTLISDERHVEGVAWSPDGKSIVFKSTENTNVEEGMITGTRLSTVAIESGEVKHICSVRSDLYQLKWAPDGKIFFITGTPEGSVVGALAVYSVDPAAASPEHAKVACGKDDNAAQLAVAGGKLLVNREVRLASVVSDLDGRELFRKDVPFQAWDVHTDASSGSSTLAVGLSTVNKPYEIFIVAEGREDVELSNHGKAVQDQSFGTCHVLTSKSSDGEVELDGLYLTPSTKVGQEGKPREPLPTFVMIHGGPTARVGADFMGCGFYWSAYLLSKGYGVLMPQYRGSTGRGEQFGMYSFGGVGKYDYADVISITDDAVNKGFADGKKLIVGGWSQGGLLSYMCSARNDLHGLGWRFNATIAGAGISDLESIAMTSDMGSTFEAELNGGRTPWTLPHDDTRNRQGSALWEVSEAVEEASRRGEPVIPPMLVLHGEKDMRCPLSQAEGYRRALRTHGLPCEFVVYPGQGHTPKPQIYWLDILERVERWCNTYIGPDSDKKAGLAIR